MTNYIQAFDKWKDTQGAGEWVLSHADFAEDDPRCITEGAVTLDGVDVTPDQQTLDAAWAAYIVDPDTITENALQTTKADILTLAEKARTHADKIGLVFAAVVTAQEASENADETFTRITNALNDAIVGNGFRDFVMTAFTAQGGTAFDFANLGGVTTVNKQRFNLFASVFAGNWTLMVYLTV